MLNISGITLTFNRPSDINGAPIGTLLQVGSNNQKTGYSLQTDTSLPLNLRMPSRQGQTYLYVVTVSVGLLLAAGVI